MNWKHYLVGCTAIAVAIPALSYAQPAPERSVELPEVVVTAQRRAEDVQKASVPIEVIGGQALSEAGVSSIVDLLPLVPGVQFANAGPATQIYIRGVGDPGSTAITNSAVAFNVDGVYAARSQAVQGNFYDLERIEVLKGPQGTLYGRNASGGAINVITNKPTFDHYSGYVKVDAGNYNHLAFEGAANIPVSTTAAFRAAFQAIRHDAYVSDGWDDADQQSARLQFRWEPSDRLSLLVGGDYSRFGGQGGAFSVMTRSPGVGERTAVSDPVAIAAFNQRVVAAGLCAPNFALPPLAFNYPGACPQPPGVPFTQLTRGDAVGSKGQDVKLWSAHAELEYDLGFATLTFLPAYRSTELFYASYPTFFYGHTGPGESSGQTSVELRLGNDTEKLKWTAGLFYFNEDQSAQFLVNAGAVQNSRADMDISTRSYAAFGQATYSVTDRLRFLGGLRYTSDERSIDSQTYIRNPALLYFQLAVTGQCGTPPSATECVMATPVGSETFEKTNWRIGLEYDLREQSMLYLTAATGFKAGGFSANLSPNTALISRSLPALAESYRPETLTAYELGLRNRFFDNRVQLNLEGFLWKYEDHQETQISIDAFGNVAQSYVNAGEATQYGLDVDLTFAPTANDLVTASVEYLHAKYDSFVYLQPSVNPANGAPLSRTGVNTACSVTPVAGVVNRSRIDCSNRQMVKAPEWTGSVSYMHRFDLSDGAVLEAKADVAFASARDLTVDFLPAQRQSAYTVVNANLTYRPESERFVLSAFVRNIGDEQIFTTAIQSPYVAGYFGGILAPPRTYGVSLRANF